MKRKLENKNSSKIENKFFIFFLNSNKRENMNIEEEIKKIEKKYSMGIVTQEEKEKLLKELYFRNKMKEEVEKK
jgi:hypothetical protein